MFGPDLATVLACAVIAGTADAPLCAPATGDRAPPAILLSRMDRHGVPPLVAALKHANPDVRRYAAWALGQSAAGDSAVADLAARLADPDPAVRAEAADALANTGRAADQALRAAVKSPDPVVRAAALRAFGSAGARRGGVALGSDYVPRGLRPVNEPSFVGEDLTQCLRDPDVVVRWAAVQYLTRVAVGRRLADVKTDALPGLRDMLFDSNAELRAAADRFLAQLGEPPAKLLQARFTDAQRRDALAQLGAFTSIAGPATGVATVGSTGRIVDARREAVRLFAVAFQFRPDRAAKFPQAKEILDTAIGMDPLTAHLVAYQFVGVATDERIAKLMLAGLEHADPGVRAEAATALLLLHEPAPPAPPEVLAGLRALSEDPVRQVRIAVLTARLKLLPVDRERAQAAAARFRDDDQQIRTIAFQATPALGELAMPELEKAARDPDPEVRRLGLMFHRSTVTQLPNATPADAVRALHVVLVALSDPSATVRRETASALSTLRGTNYGLYGPHALPKEIGDNLFDKLAELARTDPERTVRTGAIYSLATFGERAGPVLIPLLEDPAVRDTIAPLASRFGKHAPAAIPALHAMLKGTPAQQSSALSTLRHFGPAAKDAIPDLIPLLASDHARSNGIVTTLVAVEPSGERTIPAVLKVIEGLSATALEREVLLGALAPYGAKAAAAVPLLKKQMEAGVTVRTVELAAALGPKAEPVLPLLLTAVADRRANKPVSDVHAARAIAAIGTKSDDVLKALRARLADANAPAALALAALTDDKDAAALLAKVLDPQSNLCGWVLDEMQHYPVVRAKYADAIRALADAEGLHRLAAIREMVAHGEGKRYVAYLAKRLDEKGYEYGVAVRILRAIGAGAADAAPALRKLGTSAKSEWEARVIEEALAAIAPPK